MLGVYRFVILGDLNRDTRLRAEAATGAEERRFCDKPSPSSKLIDRPMLPSAVAANCPKADAILPSIQAVRRARVTSDVPPFNESGLVLKFDHAVKALYDSIVE